MNGGAPFQIASRVQGGYGTRLLDYLELTKPRLSALVLISVLLGFAMASRQDVNSLKLISVLIGVAFVSAGGSAINQFLERDLDARMERTKNRPLPAGRLFPLEVLLFGVGCIMFGVLLLWIKTNILTAALGAIAVGIYVGAYTPLKMHTSFNTLVGAITGALPPVMGWTAVTNHIDPGAWCLFALLFVWQLPHFLSLAWLYREDYANAGMKMLPVLDTRDGRLTMRQIGLFSLVLFPSSLMPVIGGMVGKTYFIAAVVLGVLFLVLAMLMFVSRSRRAAKGLFLGSLVYLPALFGWMLLDKLVL